MRTEVGKASWSTAGEGESFWFLGTLATIRVPGEAVGDRYSLIEFMFPHAASPPLHTHPQDESYVVLEGVLTIQAGEDRFVLEAGGAAAVPMGVPHTFRVESDTARVLVLSTPAGLERMVRTHLCRPRRGCCPRRARLARRPKSSNGSSARTDRSTSARRSPRQEGHRGPRQASRAIRRAETAGG